VKRLLLASTVAAALLTGCSVAEDTTAATVGGKDITVAEVAELARSPYIVQSASAEGLISSSDVVKGATTQRAALSLLVQSRVFEDAVAARKGEVTADDEQVAESQISGFEQQNAAIDTTARELLLRTIAAQSALSRLLGGDDIADAASDESVAAYFADHQQDYDQVCVDGFAVRSPEKAAAQAAVDGGADVQTVLADAALQAQAMTQDGGEVCVFSGQVTDPDLADLIAQAPEGRWTTADLDDPQAGAITVFIRANRRVAATLDDANVTDAIRTLLQEEATNEAQQKFSGEQERVFATADVEIDPRYGTWDPTAQTVLVPPPTPKLSAKATASGDAGLLGQ